MEHRKIISVILVFVLLMPLAACSAQKPPEQTLSGLQDPSLFRQQDRYDFFLETEDCYYYLYNRKIYFSSKADLCFYFLCNKPNCPHGGEDCNADGGSALGYWNGHLYSARLIGTMEPSVIRMDLDGGNHKEIAKIMLPIDENGNEGGSYSFFFHNGFLYYHVRAAFDSLFCLDLSTGKTERLFQPLLEECEIVTQSLLFSGDDMFFLSKDLPGNRILQRYHLTDKTLTEISDWPQKYCGTTVEGETIYYYDNEAGIFYEYDLVTGTTKECLHVEYYRGTPTYDSDYIYLITWDYDGTPTDWPPFRLSIFSRDYQFLGQINLSLNGEFLYDAEDVLFFTDLQSHKITKFLPKSSIGSGDLELLPLPDPYSYR